MLRRLGICSCFLVLLLPVALMPTVAGASPAATAGVPVAGSGPVDPGAARTALRHVRSLLDQAEDQAGEQSEEQADEQADTGADTPRPDPSKRPRSERPSAPPTPSANPTSRPAPVQPAGDLTLALRDLALARTSLSGADRRAADAILARPTTHYASGDRDIFDYSSTEAANLHRTCGPHICVTWTSAANAGAYVSTTTGQRLDNYASPAQAAKTLAVLEQVYAVEVGHLGYRAPLGDGPGDGSFTNYDHRIDVYLVNVGASGYYGYCTTDEGRTGAKRPAYCVLDNDFANFRGNPDDSLRVTAAHEFFHAIQFGYDITEDKWLMEGSAVWMEDEVYGSVNDYLQYLRVSPIRRPTVPVDYSNTLEMYGAFTFFKFLSGYLGSRNAVREVWQAVDAGRPGVYSLKGVKQVLKRHHRQPRKAFNRFGVWNTLAKGGYPERASYGKATFLRGRKLGRHGKLTYRTRLSHLASAPVRLKPAKKVKRKAKLRVQVKVPPKRRGGAAAVQIRYRKGKVKVRDIKLTKRGRGHRTVPFNPRKVKAVVVVMTNGSTAMVSCSGARQDRYSCGGYGRHNGKFVLRARVR